MGYYPSLDIFTQGLEFRLALCHPKETYAQPWAMGLMWEALVKHWCTLCRCSAVMTVMTPAGLTATRTFLLALRNACYQLSFHQLRAPQTFSVSQASQSYQPWESFRTAWIWVLNTLPFSCSLVPAPQKWAFPFKFTLSWQWSVLNNQALTFFLLWHGWVELVSVHEES